MLSREMSFCLGHLQQLHKRRAPFHNVDENTKIVVAPIDDFVDTSEVAQDLSIGFNQLIDVIVKEDQTFKDPNFLVVANSTTTEVHNTIPI